MKTSNIISERMKSEQVSENATPMSIDEESSVFMMNMLGKLYSRPAQAVLREYLSNALDAHASKGGQLPPVQVNLPQKNAKNPFLTIRDFGNGISEEDFSTILSRYGKSTKRDSNKLIGGFGLGAKSGFALGEEFFMTSYQAGQGLRVRLFKDVSNQGYVEVVERFRTSEPDGVLVEVAVPKSNVGELSHHQLRDFFMAYPMGAVEVYPVMDKGLVNFSVHNPDIFSPITLNGEEVGWISKKNEGVYLDNAIYINVGTVMYKVRLSNIFDSNDSEPFVKEGWLGFFSKFKNLKVISVPINSVELPSSREEITLSHKSLATIRGALSTLTALLPAHFQTEVNKLSYREAFSYAAQLEFRSLPGNTELTWRGKPLGAALMRSTDAAYISKHDNKYAEVVSATDTENIAKNDKIFLILTEGKRQMTPTLKMLEKKGVWERLLKDRNNGIINRVTFFVMPKDDILAEVFAEEGVISQSALNEASRELAIAKSRKKLEQQEREREKQAREATKLTSFILDETLNDKFPTQNFPEQVFRRARGKKYYWSEEELQQLGNATDISSLFPYKHEKKDNSYTIIPYPVDGGEMMVKNHTELIAFLRLVMPKESCIIILGKSASLEEFKASYPEVESGVEATVTAVKEQIADQNSDFNTVRNLLHSKAQVHRSEFRRMGSLWNKLSPVHKQKLDPEFLRFAESRANANKWFQLWPYFSESQIEAALKVVLPNVPAPVVSDMEGDAQDLSSKYPLIFAISDYLFKGAVLDDLILYIQAKG